MKTIQAIIAATLLLAPFAAHAQSAGTTANDETASGTTQATNTTGSDVGSAGTGTLDSDVGTAGTGTVGQDVGSTGTGTTDVGSSGTGTSGSDVGSSGTGTSGSDVGSSGTGTTPNASAGAAPALSLQAASTSLRTPGTMQVTVVLAADANLSPAQARDIVVPLASSSSACTLPASVTVAWTSADGGAATVDVACGKTRGTVTVSSGSATTSFTAK